MGVGHQVSSDCIRLVSVGSPVPVFVNTVSLSVRKELSTFTVSSDTSFIPEAPATCHNVLHRPHIRVKQPGSISHLVNRNLLILAPPIRAYGWWDWTGRLLRLLVGSVHDHLAMTCPAMGASISHGIQHMESQWICNTLVGGCHPDLPAWCQA